MTDLSLIKTWSEVSEEKSLKVVNELLQIILAQKPRKMVLLLKGPMAAGKTTFVRQLIESMGGASVQSPTFAIHQRYQTNYFEVDHLDLYRLKSDLELDGIGFWDLFESPEGLIILEWPERMKVQDLPENWKKIELEIKLESELSRTYQARWIV
jgi:tRNA threonylcarbamoyladenosine biosynthesis protein TsaE